VRSFHGPFFEDERLFSVPGALPRVFLAGGARVSANGFEVLEDPAFDPAREVILAEGVPHAAPPGFSGDARVLEMRPDRLVVETEANASSHLVFVDAYDPGWHATLDGSPAPVLRANLAFRAVSVPAGRHRVEMRYLPRSVEIGLGLSALSVVLGLALLARAPRERSE
jgi:hypothetical protein